LDSLRRVVDLYLGAGIDGVTALGVTAEVGKLIAKERATVLDTIMKQVGGRVPVVVGATAEGLGPCMENTRDVRAEGAVRLERQLNWIQQFKKVPWN